MRPDQRWFPTNRVERAAWFNNFSAQFAKVALGLGFTQDDIDSVNADNEMLQFTSRTILAVESYMSAVQAFQKTVTLGRNGTGTSQFPALPNLNVPPNVPTGIFERLERLVRRVRVAPAYTPETGALLNIIPKQTYGANLADAVPTVKISQTSEPYSFAVRTAKRNFTSFQVEIMRGSSDKWEMGGFFTSSPGIIRVEPIAIGQPELLQVRLRMISDNQPVGKFSDIKIVTVMP